MFEVPEYGISKVAFTAIGVFVLWASWGKGGLSVKYLNTALARLGMPPNWLLLVEFGVTMVLGVVVAIAIVDPQTARQAFVAGMGWTGLVTRPTDAAAGED